MLQKRYQILILKAQSVWFVAGFFVVGHFFWFFLAPVGHSVLPTGFVSLEGINEPFISRPLLYMLKKISIFINFRVVVVTLRNCVEKNREKNLTVLWHNSLVHM